MGEGAVEVVRVGRVEKHPNADALGVTAVRGYPVVVRLGELREGELAIYVPVDSVVPEGEPRWAFLGEHRRIRAKRLRGVFSMGLLVPAEPGAHEGEEVGGALGIVRWEPPEPVGGDEKVPFEAPVYDVEGLRKWSEVLVPGEPVQVTEKIHGCNGRFVFREGRLWCGSRTRWKAEGASEWWRVAEVHFLRDVLARAPGVVVYGEVYGAVQDLRYGVVSGVRLAVFDAWDLSRWSGGWAGVGEMDELLSVLRLPRVPELWRGPWDPTRVSEWAEGSSTMASHVREGFVVRPLEERWHEGLGRVILKRHGEGYLLRKGG